MIETITDTKDINNFTQALGVDQWELASLPDNASKLGSLRLSKQKSIQLFDANSDQTLYDVGTIILYEEVISVSRLTAWIGNATFEG